MTLLNTNPIPTGCLLLIAVLGIKVSGFAQLSSDRIEVLEAQTAMGIAQAKVQEVESKLASIKTRLTTLEESLSTANSEAAFQRDAYEKLRAQTEGLGIASLGSSSFELQQKLLSALSDLRILDRKNRSLTEAIILLSESAVAYAKDAPAATEEKKQSLNRSLGVVEKTLAGSEPNTGSHNVDLQNVSVVSLKNELGIAVLNAGSKQGVHPGMPFAIFRQDRAIGRAMAIDVRPNICGAVIQDIMSQNEPVKVGDVGKVEATKS
jgi:hypothetical protein